MVIAMMLKIKRGPDYLLMQIFTPYGVVEDSFDTVYTVFYDSKDKTEKVMKYDPDSKEIREAFFEVSAVFVRNNTALVYLAHPLQLGIRYQPSGGT